MRGSPWILTLLVCATNACGAPYSGEAAPEPPDAGPARVAEPPVEAGVSGSEGGTPATVPLPECKAQRVVHLSATNGALGWFTLLWPTPEIFANPRIADAYDDLTKAVAVRPSSDPHPLYVRKDGADALWKTAGAHPMPSVFVAGNAVVLSDAPRATFTTSGNDIVAAGAAAQRSLTPLVPVFTFPSAPYGTALDAPPATAVTDTDAAIAVLATKGLSPAELQTLRPDVATLASYGIDVTSPNKLVALAKFLAFTAAAFRLGAVGTVVMPALRDDPHEVDGRIADALAKVLGGFYRALAQADEPRCGHRGARLSLADNVVMIVTGDTPRNPFERNAWPAGPPGGTNILYARANGWLTPGWFGAIAPNARTSFDPKTGALSPSTSPYEASDAALGGILYAITRGSAPVVALTTTAPYQGTLASTPP